MRNRRTGVSLLIAPLLIAAAGVAGAAPADPEARLQCALDRVPADARSRFTRLYAAEKSRADMDTVIPDAAYGRMIDDCLDPAPADLEARATRLGQAVMSWHLMHLAKASLGRDHAVSDLAADQAYQALSAADRAQLTGSDPTPIVLRLTARLRPDLVGAAQGAADEAYLDLVEDIAVYAASRALLEAVAGQY